MRSMQINALCRPLLMHSRVVPQLLSPSGLLLSLLLLLRAALGLLDKVSGRLQVGCHVLYVCAEHVTGWLLLLPIAGISRLTRFTWQFLRSRAPLTVRSLQWRMGLLQAMPLAP